MTKADVTRLKQENIRLYGLSFEYYNNIQVPKAKTKEWLKVLTIPEILRDKTRFSTSQKI